MVLRYRYAKTTAAKTTGRRTDAAARVMQWVRAMIADGETGVSLSGGQCGHAACIGGETVVLLMPPNEPTIAIRILKSLEAVTEVDVRDALQSRRPRA